MKLKTTGILTLISVLSIAANANALPLIDIYAGGTAGIGHTKFFTGDDKIGRAAQSYGAMVGLDMPIIRLELEYNYLHTNDSAMNIGMLNAYLKIPSVVVKPYVGAGLGTIFSGNIDLMDISTTAAFQGMLGLTFDIPVLPFDIDAEARVLYAPDIIDIMGIKPDLLHYDARIKIRYVF